MSFGLSICWQGPPGSGKRHALQEQLQAWARSIGQHYVLKKQLWNAPTQGGEDESSDSEEEEDAEKSCLPMEYSIIHWGFDVARMSLKDKQFVKSILTRWGKGGQVLSTIGHTKRCLVFYHAHLLSSESILFLQAFLEENYQDTVVWLTSEYPLPFRIADWYVEIPVPGRDRSLQLLQSNTPEPILTLEDEIHTIYKFWLRDPPTLNDVKKIRELVNALLHRNIRWVEGFHIWLFALNRLPLTPEQKEKTSKVCISQPFTGPGQTVPSYRIPILWESYLCGLRNALAPS